MPSLLYSDLYGDVPDTRVVEGPVWVDDIFDDLEAVVSWLRQEASFSVVEGTFQVAEIPDLIRQVLRTEVERLLPVASHGLSVARCSTETVDTGVRIHADQGMGCSHAWVWYSHDPPEDPDPWGGNLFGTGFFTHETQGSRFRGTAADHDRLLAEESMDESCWTLRRVVPMRANRLTVYPSDLFHSRYPHQGWGTSPRDGRLVIVGFCTAKGYDGKTVDSGGD